MSYSEGRGAHRAGRNAEKCMIRRAALAALWRLGMPLDSVGILVIQTEDMLRSLLAKDA